MPEILVRALRGESTPRRPLWLMRQAGRMLPEYRELKERYSFRDLSSDPEMAAEVTLLPFQRFPFDGAIVFADLMSPVAALGIEVDYAPGPVIDTPIASREHVERLRDPDPEEIAPEVIETLRLVAPELDDEVALLGFAGGPWSIAAYLVQGESKREFPGLRAFARSEPGATEGLLTKLARLCGDYLVQQARAGAQAVQVFETWSGILSRSEWDRVVKPHLRALLERAEAGGVPRILFLKNAPHLIESASELPADALAVDWRIDLPSLRQQLGDARPLQGNLDPAVLLAGPDATRAAARELLSRMPARGHVMNLGHGVLPQTPLESVEALVEAVHEESTPERSATGDDHES